MQSASSGTKALTPTSAVALVIASESEATQIVAQTPLEVASSLTLLAMMDPDWACPALTNRPNW